MSLHHHTANGNSIECALAWKNTRSSNNFIPPQYKYYSHHIPVPIPLRRVRTAYLTFLSTPFHDPSFLHSFLSRCVKEEEVTQLIHVFLTPPPTGIPAYYNFHWINITVFKINNICYLSIICGSTVGTKWEKSGPIRHASAPITSSPFWATWKHIKTTFK